MKRGKRGTNACWRQAPRSRAPVLPLPCLLSLRAARRRLPDEACAATAVRVARASEPVTRSSARAPARPCSGVFAEQKCLRELQRSVLLLRSAPRWLRSKKGQAFAGLRRAPIAMGRAGWDERWQACLIRARWCRARHTSARVSPDSHV